MDIQSNTLSHLNFMNGTSFDISNPLLRLRCAAASCFFGEPSYYINGEKKKAALRHNYAIRELSNDNRKYLRDSMNAIDDPQWHTMTTKSLLESAIDKAIEYDAEATLQYAIYLRMNEFIRVTPQVIIVRAANNPALKHSGLIRQYARAVMKRMDEPSIQLKYQLNTFGKPIPNGLKRAWSDVLKNANHYSLAKYRKENDDVKTVDVANLAYGNGFYGYNEKPIGKLMHGDLCLDDEHNTWQNIRSNGGKWEDAIPVMGHAALLKNIRNFIINKVDTNLWMGRFMESAEHGMQLPFRYYTAYNYVSDIASVDILDALQDAMFNSIKTLPNINGNNLILVDNSGSARGETLSELGKTKISDVGNLMGIITGFVSDTCKIGVFGDRLKYYIPEKTGNIFDQLTQVDKIGSSIGMGTENGIWIALNEAIQNKDVFDNIFIYSDMQAGHGGLYGINPDKYKNYIFPNTRNMIDIPHLINDYRAKVNSKVNVFLVQIAGYQDTLIPEFYERTYIIGGWSSGILNFAHSMNNMFDSNS